MTKDMLELAERWCGEVLKLDDARASTVYGALSPFAIFGPAHVELKRAGLIETFIPVGAMGLMTKLTPKGRKAAAALRARANNQGG